MYAASADPKADINVASIDANAITATAIASDAITAAKIATGAIDADALAADTITAAKIATGAITAAKFAAGAIDAAAVADGAIDAATFAAGAITASAIAADAIGASELAADAVTEIQSGLATAAALDAVDNFIDTEIADIQARLPAALVGGRMDSSVGAMEAGTLTASALAADAVDEIIDEVIEGSVTLRQLLRGFASALLGKASGLATTTAVYRDTTDAKDRITATVDADGNRTAVTLDLT
jgi:hypothetical protein